VKLDRNLNIYLALERWGQACYFVILLFRQRCSEQRWDQVKAPIKTGRR